MAKADRKQIYVLGIHDGHNAGAALICDGQVVAAVSEERLNNIKNFSGMPVLAIRKVFEIAGVQPQDISVIAVGCLIRLGDPLKVKNNPVHIAQEIISPYLHSKWFIKTYVNFLHLFRKNGNLGLALQELGLEGKPIVFVEHHQTHAACAYYQRPWDEEALILTLDGMGDGLSATVNVGRKFRIKRIAGTSFYDSLSNNLYSEVTGFLGLKRWEHEYKLMGLAPYGKAEYAIEGLRNIIRINPKSPLEFENISGRYLKNLQPLYQKILSEQRFDNVAAATQTLFEELVTQWIKNAIRETKISRIVCAGGAFLNVKANKLIREMPEVKDVFFYPSADDGGTPVGAALEGYYCFCEDKNIKPERSTLSDIYYGQMFDNVQIINFLKSKKLTRKAKQVSGREVAKLLAEGKIIARFAGREEWGPRALGNRSIMADPRDTQAIRKINFAIKQRDFWMPFAPAILEEDQPRYLKNGRFAPYMIEAFDTKPEARDLIAGLHPFDLTARPQTVNGWNPGWQRIIREFKGLTGVGAILNTSFNLHGSPIVGDLEVAYWTYQNSGLDGLLLEDWLIER